jgi:subtilase family serine protease
MLMSVNRLVGPIAGQPTAGPLPGSTPAAYVAAASAGTTASSAADATMTPDLDLLVQPNRLVTVPITGPLQGPILTPVDRGPFTPAQIRHAYGFDQIDFPFSPRLGLSPIPGDGRGQTIAIVDAFNDPSVAADLTTFDQQYGLPAAQFTVVKQTVNGQAPGYNANWSLEVSLDVEWAHAIAPGAKIVLFEAHDNSTDNLFAMVDRARSYAGVSVVSMSWGGSESAQEFDYDIHLTTPSGHVPVTFVASTGDSPSAIEYPAVSPSVLAVGGTSLAITLGPGNYAGEVAWAKGGGGVSALEPMPAYQGTVENILHRSVPDVAYDADPSTGLFFYNSGLGGWGVVGGTSAGAPQWAALIAIANQGRALQGNQALATAIQDLYYLNPADFHDITAGSNGHAATKGYDLATGLGSPIANLLVPALVAAEGIPNPIFGPGTILTPVDFSSALMQIGATSPLAFTVGQATAGTLEVKLEANDATMHVSTNRLCRDFDSAIRRSVGDAAPAGIMPGAPTVVDRTNRTTPDADVDLALAAWLTDDAGLDTLRSWAAADGLVDILVAQPDAV